MDFLKIILDTPNQVRDGVKLAKGVKIEGEVSKVLVCGMGGSGIPGNLLQTYLRESRLPVWVSKSYSVPGWVDSKTLVFCISYSGNTEETVSMFKEALKARAQVVCITSGGRLKELAKKHEKTIIQVPRGFPPRAAVAYLFFPLLVILHNSKLIKINSANITETMNALRKPAIKLKAMDLADQLHKKIPVIYCSGRLSAVGLRWKQEFNEDTKIHAYFNVYSEMNHNELEAYEYKAVHPFHVIFLRDEKDHPQIRKRFDITKDLIKRKGYPVTEIMLRGNSLLQKMFTALMMGDLTSLYLAEKYGHEPMKVKLIEDLKKKLAKK